MLEPIEKGKIEMNAESENITIDAWSAREILNVFDAAREEVTGELYDAVEALREALNGKKSC